MVPIYRWIKTSTTLTLALACVGLVLLWPTWRADLRAETSYGELADLCEEATLESESFACHGLCVAAVLVCCDGDFPEAESCEDAAQSAQACQLLTSVMLEFDCGLSL